MLLVYGILNWFLGLFGFTENKGFLPSIFSDYSDINDKPGLLFITFLGILAFALLLQYFAETKQPNDSTSDYGNEEYQSLIYLLEEDEEEQHSDQLGLGFIAVDEQPAGDSTETNGGGNGGQRERASCAFCGDLSTTRCSRCKTARYCSQGCQILHWRLVHKNECRETNTVVPETHSHPHEASRIVKSKMERYNEWNSEVGNAGNTHNPTWRSTEASGNGYSLSNCFSCAVCGGPATTRCSRCKAVKYCSAKCLIEDWRWHKVECSPRNVDSAHTERSPRNFGLLKNSHQEKDHDHSPHPLALGFYSEGTTNIKPLIRSSQEPTKRAQDHTADGEICHEDEIAKFRNEIVFLREERDKWASRANFAKQRYQSFKKEAEHQLLVLTNEKEVISNAEAQAQIAVRRLSERLQDMQLRESFAEKKKQEEYIHKLESKCVALKRELQKGWEHIQELSAEHDENHKTAQIAMREVEEKEKELQLERERVQLLKEDFRRDVAAAESRAMIAEAKLFDLDRKIRSRNDKVAVWTDGLGRPAMACAICLTNEKDLAFGCGHMTCRDCGSKLTKCPICREQITNFVRLYPG